MVFRRRSSKEQPKEQEVDPGLNPNRTGDLFAPTKEGYIMAQDVTCQAEFIQNQRCPNCRHELIVVAKINRAFQGLNELVTVCRNCGESQSFIFDISNEVYQTWWAERMGDMYVRTYDGTPRSPSARSGKQR